jgi:probable rRNA maturation factor
VPTTKQKQIKTPQKARTMPTESVDILWLGKRKEDPAFTSAIRVCAERLQLTTKTSDRELSLVLTDDPTIMGFNQQWRGEHKPTDVLSFPMDEGAAGQADVPENPLGDIVISLDTAELQASEHAYSLLQEVTFLLVHGFCHLLGHDHGDPEQAALMRAEEDRLLAYVAPGQSRPPTPY